MRRADRLFQIVNHLRSRRLTTAAQLGDWLSVSERTIYRDIRDLTLSGVPIEGEAGVGYVLRQGYDLPPLMLDQTEAEALALGAHMVHAWTTPAMALAVDRALAKIMAILPAPQRRAIDAMRVHVPAQHIPPQLGERLAIARESIAGSNVLTFVYLHDDARVASERTVRPLALYFWGYRWTLAAWCETRAAFRNFRVDRMVRMRIDKRVFAHEAGKSLADFQRDMVDLDD
jgi:predicted DNA-binding transcriptional regulator YafY